MGRSRSLKILAVAMLSILAIFMVIHFFGPEKKDVIGVKTDVFGIRMPMTDAEKVYWEKRGWICNDKQYVAQLDAVQKVYNECIITNLDKESLKIIQNKKWGYYTMKEGDTIESVSQKVGKTFNPKVVEFAIRSRQSDINKVFKTGDTFEIPIVVPLW